MPAVETSTRKIIARLKREGWEDVGGTKHDKFAHPDRKYSIIVPRHRVISIGVAKNIAREAGWL